MTIVNQHHTQFSERVLLNSRAVSPLKFIHGSFSSKKASRQSPVLAGMHRVTDGALTGVILTVALMSTFALHWQHLWTVAFTRLERTRDLAHRLTESTAMLERHLLQSTSLPKSMVPTKAANLIYLENPYINGHQKQPGYSKSTVLNSIIYKPVSHGY